MRSLIFALLLVFSLQANEESSPSVLPSFCAEGESFPIVDIEGTPNSVVGGCVNAISGDYFDFQRDLFMAGSEPLVVERSYSSSDSSQGGLSRSWQINLQGVLRIRSPGHRFRSAVWKGSFGSEVTYMRGPDKTLFALDPAILKRGVSNNSSGAITGKNNLKNSFVVRHTPTTDQYTLFKGDGSKLIFQPFTPTKGKVHYLQKEIKPNQMEIAYFYDKQYDEMELNYVMVLNPLGNYLQALHLDYSKALSAKHPRVILSSNDERKITYNLQPFTYTPNPNRPKETYTESYLSEVNRPNGPKENYFYSKIGAFERVIYKLRPDKRFTRVNYYMPQTDYEGIVYGETDPIMYRIRSIDAPIGKDDSEIPAYTFYYNLPHGGSGEGSCAVLNAHKARTDYVWDDEHRLREVIRYTSDGTPYTKDKLFFGGAGSATHGNLTSRAFFCGDQALFCRYYHYDIFGNVVLEQLFGNLTGLASPPLAVTAEGTPIPTGCDKFEKRRIFSEDGKNLLLSETEGPRTKNFKYYSNSDLVEVAYVLNGSDIVMRHAYNYDENKAVTIEVIDDGYSNNQEDLAGVTFRKIRTTLPKKSLPWCLPEIIEEHYQDPVTLELFLSKVIANTYSLEGKLTRQDHYDANRVLAYSLYWEYDAMGNVILEKNALGETTHKSYDLNGNLIWEQGPQNFYKTFAYDFSNRLIRVAEVHPEQTLFTHYRYDLLGRKEASIDSWGNETNYAYDEFDRLIGACAPAILNEYGEQTRPSIFKKYDAMGNVIEKIDANGQSTKYFYTIRGQPSAVFYPDGTKEHLVYFEHGPLHYKTERSGCTTVYTRDYQDRVIATACYGPDQSLLWQTTATYNAFQLLSETDAMGHVTVYTYDVFGRKKSAAQGDRLETYEYDSLGRLGKKSVFTDEDQAIVKIYEYDLLDRLVVERTEDSFGHILDQVSYAYDAEGRRTQVIVYDHGAAHVTETRYNSYGIPHQVIDPLGNVTTTNLLFCHRNELGQSVPYIETIDPTGKTVVTIKDALGRDVVIFRKGPFGEPIQVHQLLYDKSGNLCRHVDTVYNSSTPARVIETWWFYNSMSRVVNFIEALGSPDQKTTQYFYNHLGQLDRIQKPSGIEIYHGYSLDGLLTNFWSSDGTVNYHYSYDLSQRLILCKDEVNKRELVRTYDENDRLVREVLGNGNAVSTVYDRADRPTSLTFQDNSTVNYGYSGPLLNTVARVAPSGQELYRHAYDAYNHRGKPTSETLVGKGGKRENRYDGKGRQVELKTNYTHEIVPPEGFDAADNLVSREFTDSHGVASCFYMYDNLYQLTYECGTASHRYSYDSVYNRVSKNDVASEVNYLNQVLSAGDKNYAYDLDGNLIELSSASDKVKFGYDALDRLISVTCKDQTTKYSYDNFNRRLTKTTPANKVFSYLYDGQNEIGCCTNNNLVQFRALGLGLGAEIGAAVAIELYNKVFTPLHDRFGNVIALVDSSGNIAESYRYSAFGEETLFDSANNVIKTSALDNPWRFASKRFDNESSLTYFGRRYYDAAQGRFITKDPLGFDGGPNLYAFVSNSPLTRLDLYGLYALRDFEEGSLTSLVRDAIDFTVGSVSGLVQGIIDPFEPIQNYFSGHTPYSEYSSSFQSGETFGKWAGAITTFAPLGAFKVLGMGSRVCTAASTIGKIETALNAERVTQFANLERAYGITQVFKNTLNAERSVVEGLSGYNTFRKAEEFFVAAKAESGLVSELAIASNDFSLNRFNQAAQNLSEVGQNNIRVLRSWAESKGWEKAADLTGPETWGQTINGKFVWNLKIKAEGSFRPNLEAGSNIPRFDARHDQKGQRYVNPFTGEIGDKNIGKHLPLEHIYF